MFLTPCKALLPNSILDKNIKQIEILIKGLGGSPNICMELDTLQPDNPNIAPIDPFALNGNLDEISLTSECSIADQIGHLYMISYNFHGNRDVLMVKLRHLAQKKPNVIHCTEYRTKPLPLKGYKLMQMNSEQECDRQSIYVKTGLDDVSLISTNSKFSHTIKIMDELFSFTYFPPRYKSQPDSLMLEIQFGIRLGSTESRFDRYGRNFEVHMTENCYIVLHSPMESTMVALQNCLDQAWVHQRHQSQFSQIQVLNSSNTGSDHYPIFFRKSLESPISILRKIQWNLIQSGVEMKNRLISELSHKLIPLYQNLENMTTNEI
eukprot:NODE_294_length_10530_cov_0.245326.p1 type:complete len:321 gc:universal NODE_294_length_10530_cov_0.245326:1222-2184(+)